MSLRTTLRSPLLRALAVAASVAAPLVTATSAHAQPGAQGAASPAPALPPPTPASPAPVAQAPAAPEPAGPVSVPITQGCSLGEHGGLDEAEVRTAADIVCHDLARAGAPAGNQYELRVGKLGGKLLFTLAERSSAGYDERRAFVQGFDEVPTASPRLVSSLLEKKPLDETLRPDNVLASEARQQRTKTGRIGFDGGLVGAMGVGAKSAVSAGVDLGLEYASDAWGLGMHGRLLGAGSGDGRPVWVGLDVGGRYYLLPGDVSPFVGAGISLAYLNLIRENAANLDGGGLGAYAAVGLEAFRSSRVALTMNLRADAPFYEVEAKGATRYVVSGTGTSTTQDPGEAKYVVPVSLMMGLHFH